MRTLAGIQPVSAGRILLAGHPVETLRQQLPLAVGYLPQFGAFHGELTVAEILDFTVSLRLPSSVPKATRDQWSEHVIDLARIRTFLHQKYRTLSGGQMRRIALAEELIGDPAFLFLDELTSGLDPYSEHELMVWLKDLAHTLKKTIVLVTHAVSNLRLCDSVVLLHEGRLCFQGPYDQLLATHGSESIEAIYGGYQQASLEGSFVGFDDDRSAELPAPPAPHALNTAPPPGSFSQLATLLHRQNVPHLAGQGDALAAPRAPGQFSPRWSRSLPRTACRRCAAWISGCRPISSSRSSTRWPTPPNRTRPQPWCRVCPCSRSSCSRSWVRTTARGEIAKERDVLQKELRAGLSPWAYVTTKGFLVVGLSLAQAFWMTWFVKVVCGFKGDFFPQFEILFCTTLAVSVTCLAISSLAKSPERASLLAIYLVGLQLPLSGAVLALPELVSTVCRPFIAAYWGWSGYLKTLSAYSLYDTVRQSTNTHIADFSMCILVLSLHSIVCGVIAWIFVARSQRQG